MVIRSTRLAPLTRPSEPASPPVAQAIFPSDPQDGWVSAGCSILGGAIALGGALANQPLVAAGGMLTTAAATAFSARRAQLEGAMDRAAWISLAGGGALTLVGAATLLNSPISPAGSEGPLPTLLRQIGIQALPM